MHDPNQHAALSTEQRVEGMWAPWRDGRCAQQMTIRK
jgi:hypothetical protein